MTAKKDVAAVAEGMSSVVEQPQSAMDIMARAVLAGDVSIEVLQALKEMNREEMERQARMAFFGALSAAQGDFPPVPKTKVVPDKTGREKYRYAPLEVIERVVGPVLRQHGFSWTHDTQPSEGGVTAICRLHHAEGHTETSTVFMPTISIIHANAGQNMSGTMTMAIRRAFCNATGVVPEDDIDGAEPGEEKTITAEQAADLEALITEVGADRGRFLVWARVADLSELAASRYAAAVTALEARRGR